MRNELDNKTDTTYLVKIKALVRYTSEEAPNESHVITPITNFVRKTARTYGGVIVGIGGGIVEEGFIMEEDDEDD